jgi:phosphate starvation-inducible membrane PsiE
MKKTLQTILVFALILAGSALVGPIGDFTIKKCQLVASQLTCRIPYGVVVSLIVFFVAYFGIKKLKEIWPPKVSS